MKLDIGCGTHYQEPLTEWTHQDATQGPHTEYVCDWKTIPVDTESVDEIHLGDVVEHIPAWEMEATLGEWNRVLKIGGVFHGATPNLDRIMRDYAGGSLAFQDAVNGLYGWADTIFQQHYMTYTKHTLTVLMGRYGFSVESFIESPGPKECPWWLVFRGRKTARAIWRNYAH